MGHKMTPLPFETLMSWVRSEHGRTGSIFGVKKLYSAPEAVFSIFGEKLETPVGPAAGPGTQLAQNIIAAYAAGARFFELKTVQVIDGEKLAEGIPRPCILAADEGYNCEWSTELTTAQALEEYIKAWCAIKIISRLFSLGSPEGFVFNMSLGYDLAGIKSEKIDGFINRLTDASGAPAFVECKAILSRMFPEDASFIDSISPNICRSATLSTLHGCPPDEIERIASHLILEKRLNTCVKCNPTLLGYEFVRNTLDDLGYGYVRFGAKHFDEDLQYSDAVPMFARLKALADSCGLVFGVKISNTLPVDTAAFELPSAEMYMSGRALYPLAVSMARRLTGDFPGGLPISFAGGADAFNLNGLLGAGIWPVTVATTILKPGGYERFYQLAGIAADSGAGGRFAGADAEKLARLAEDSMANPRYRKPLKPDLPRKSEKKLPLFDCFTAPCRDGCPIGQDAPGYMRLAGEGRYSDALSVIVERNPLPFTTGALCPHKCQDRCIRNYYDEPVNIRSAKLEIAERAYDELLAGIRPPSASGKRAAIVGGGPAGLAAAWFLARAGWEAVIFEREAEPGGLVRSAIPEFRIPAEFIDRDVAMIRAMGVEIRCNEPVFSVFSLRKKGYDAVIVATGAEKPGALEMEFGWSVNVIDFLSAFKKSPEVFSATENIAVIGGGDNAVDAARAARRLPGNKNVSIVYRRNRRYMPAGEEELRLAISEGVVLRELLAPIGYRDGLLSCRKMTLGEKGGDGRPACVPTDETETMPVDFLIAATGGQVFSCEYAEKGFELDGRGFIRVDPDTLESSIPGVYVVGDGLYGPATVVDAIADAMNAVSAVTGVKISDPAVRTAGGDLAVRAKKGVISPGCEGCADSDRCLECEAVCEICAEVCPNRANISVRTAGGYQIVHIDALCNECGNCAVFCPWDGSPHREKLTLFCSEEDFGQSKNPGFLPHGGGMYRVRLDGDEREAVLAEIPRDVAEVIREVESSYPFLPCGAR